MFRRNPLLRLIFSANTDPVARPILAEPTTSLTDAVMAGQTLIYANRLRTGMGRMRWFMQSVQERCRYD